MLKKIIDKTKNKNLKKMFTQIDTSINKDLDEGHNYMANNFPSDSKNKKKDVDNIS